MCYREADAWDCIAGSKGICYSQIGAEFRDFVGSSPGLSSNHICRGVREPNWWRVGATEVVARTVADVDSFTAGDGENRLLVLGHEIVVVWEIVSKMAFQRRPKTPGAIRGSHGPLPDASCGDWGEGAGP